MMWTTKKSIAIALFLAVSTVFCISSPGIVQALPEPGQKSEAKLAAIDSINVSGEGDATELVINLSSPATYTSYKTTAPLRLVLDLSQATQGNITAPLVINKGNFKTITVSRYDTDAGVLTRVDVELVRDAEAIVSAKPNQKGQLRISFPTLSEQLPAKVVDEPVVAAEAGSAVIKSETNVTRVNDTGTAFKKNDSAVSADTAAEEPAKFSANTVAMQLRSLTGISAINESIILAIEGGAGDFKSFRLNKPERFVIDLFDVKSGLADRIIPVNSAGVASARLGLYPDKVRVVLDAVTGNFPEAVAVKSEQGVTIALNVKEAADNPNTRLVSARTGKTVEPEKQLGTEQKQSSASNSQETVSPVKQPMAKTAGKAPSEAIVPASVEMIDFQVVEGVSRVAVKVVGKVFVDAPVKTPGFVTITIKNVLLPKSLQRSLETRSFISPVLRVTPVVVNTGKGTDTKIRIALRADAPYEFKQEGDMLYVNFKNPEGLTADKIPAELQDASAMTANGAKGSTAKEADISAEIASNADGALKSVDTSKSYKGRKVTLEFADAEVRKIFQLLSEVSNKNFVLGDDVSGTISIKLVNVPWDQALDIILDTKGLDKREDGNIIIIKAKGKFKSQAEEEQEIKKQQFRSIELKTETFSINYADIASIVGQFTALKSDRGAIVQDTRTNKVIVKDIPQAIEDMRKLLQQLDVPEKQVMIEARIVEATSTFTRSLGVNWGVHYRDGSASFMGINSLDTGFGGLTSAPPTAGTGLSPGGAMGISFGTLTSNIQLDMRLNAAASAGLIKIVSTPKVATINNKTAKITQGQQIPYTSSTSDKVETKFIEAALSLEVTPHINANGTIGMKIDAKNDSPGTSSGGTAPPINKKQATTEMLLRDGETTVIGGIYVDSDTEADDGVPFLMDIPFLGNLFKTKNKNKSKTELLIFITPRILGAI